MNKLPGLGGGGGGTNFVTSKAKLDGIAQATQGNRPKANKTVILSGSKAIKNNIANAWWKEMTRNHENIVGLDSGILMHPKIWEASGHVGEFHDPLVDCKHCGARYRADELADECDF